MGAVNRLAMLTVLAMMLGGCAGTRQPEAPTGPALRVMTYNVNFGGARMDLAADAIEESGADVVCLQETTPAWEAYLRARLAERYPFAIFRHAAGPGGMGVLARREVEEVDYVWPGGEYGSAKGAWFAGWVLKAQSDIGAVQILAVHLRPPLGEGVSVDVGAYFQTQQIRRNEIEGLFRHLADGEPTLVLGDFNEGDGGKAVEFLRERGFTDSLREFDAHTQTWHWRTSVMTFKGRYDHILYSKGMYCYEATVMQRGASDHWPVVAVVGR